MQSRFIVAGARRGLALALLAGCAIEPNPSPTSEPTMGGIDDRGNTDGLAGGGGTPGFDGEGGMDGTGQGGEVDGGKDGVTDSPGGTDGDPTYPGADAGSVAGDVTSSADVTEPPPAACPVVDSVPCGGELTGTWRVVAFCPDDPAAAAALCQNPFDAPECADTKRACPFVRSGTLTFTAGQGAGAGGAAATGPATVSGQAAMDTTTSIAATYEFSAACVLVQRPSAPDAATACAELTTEKLHCAFDGAVCHCSGVTEPEVAHDALAYSAVDDTLTLGDAAATFCVSGDRLTIDFAQHPISWRWWVLTR